MIWLSEIAIGTCGDNMNSCIYATCISCFLPMSAMGTLYYLQNKAVIEVTFKEGTDEDHDIESLLDHVLQEAGKVQLSKEPGKDSKSCFEKSCQSMEKLFKKKWGT